MASTDYTTLKNFGLIEPSGNIGEYNPSEIGIKFISNTITIPKYYYTDSNTFSDETHNYK